MSHDLEDLLNLIKELEERILNLERQRDIMRNIQLAQYDDAWYWEHG